MHTPVSRLVDASLVDRFRIAVALLVCAALLSSSCTAPAMQKINTAQVPQPAQERIMGVTLKDGTDVTFDNNAAVVRQGRVEANVKGSPYSVALTDVQRLWVERREVSALRTIGLVAGVLAGGLILAIAMKQSCPFVYSWDGTKYVFDAEPYGGAITRGLERDDYAELSHLREHNGEYRLLVTNEVDETQHTNLMELWVVDHAPGSRIVADEHGGLHALQRIAQPVEAKDRYGKNLLPWLEATDKKIWEPETIAGPDGSLRQELRLTFGKPEGAREAILVVNAATGLWGSYMLKKMVELRGQEAPAYLAAIDREPQAAEAVHAWTLREETYRLQIEVKEPTGWQTRGTLFGSGPFLSEDRAIALDISQVEGPQLEIRMRPPVGFWAFNSFGVSYEPHRDVAFSRLSMKSARTIQGRDVLAEMTRVDDRYYRMPEMTDRAEIIFPAPPRTEKERTIFLHTVGWYELHLKADGPAQSEAISKIREKPGGAAEFAAAEFAEWQRMAKSKSP